MTFTVFGEPKPAGSKAIGYNKDGQPFVRPSGTGGGGTKPWMGDVSLTAISEWAPREAAMIDGPVILGLRFYFPRPESHYGTGRNAGQLKSSAALLPERTGYDVDKLVRAIKDALKGIVYTNDRRVVEVHAERLYGAPSRCEITVTRPAHSTVGEAREAEAAVEEDAPPPQLELAEALAP